MLVLFCALTCIQAQKPPQNYVLWKIEHSELDKPSYLFGTLHIMCTEDFNLSKQLLDALKDSEKLVLEVNLSDPEEIKAMQGFLANPKKISEEITTEQFDALNELTENALNMPLSGLDTTDFLEFGDKDYSSRYMKMALPEKFLMYTPDW